MNGPKVAQRIERYLAACGPMWHTVDGVSLWMGYESQTVIDAVWSSAGRLALHQCRNRLGEPLMLVRRTYVPPMSGPSPSTNHAQPRVRAREELLLWEFCTDRASHSGT